MDKLKSKNGAWLFMPPPDALAVCWANRGLPVGFILLHFLKFYLLLSPIFSLSPSYIFIYMF